MIGTGPLLETKLYAPRPQRPFVSRARLIERLARVVEVTVTLVSAPAGFGKTTLLAELAAATRPEAALAWLSLDARDNDPATFWTYVTTALDRAAPGVGVRAHGILDAPPPQLEAVLGALSNDLASQPRDVVLVLDDYHVIDSPQVQEGMAFLLEHLPPQAHVVIGTRADPPLPLARLRAKGQLVEIRAADLRFQPDEAAVYLNDAMGLALTERDVATLEGRTEGWIAALQLAALSMQGRDDVAAFIDGFTGDDRYIVDYLVEEVLARQPEGVREFLLRTSILARMSGPLCDAVTGQHGGKATLESLDRANLFVVPLDDRRRWYRYHHLFADVLQARLLDEEPDTVPALHRRASDWHEENGDRAEAIRHALAGKHFERAADLVELSMPEMLKLRQESVARAWMDALPHDLFAARPVLALAYVGALMSTGRFDGVDALLEAAERAVAEPATVVVVDQAQAPRIAGMIARYRAAQALAAGDMAATTSYAQQALDAAADDDPLGRGAAGALLGLAAWSSGDLDRAYRSYADGMSTLERGGHLPDAVGGGINLAAIRVAQGRLGEAMRIYERGLGLATASGGAPLRGAADMHVGIADILYERNDLEGMREHLEASRALGEENGFPRHPWRSRVAAARLRRAEGDFEGAIALLDEAERRYDADFAPNVRPVAAVRARVLVADGRLAEASAWARERGLSATDELDYLHEFEHLVFARLLLEQGGLDDDLELVRQAASLADRLLLAADEGGRAGSAIEVLVVQALARSRIGDAAGAIASLTRAVALAKPEGYVRAFVDEGQPMAELLKFVARERASPAYVRRLLAAFVPGDERRAVPRSLAEPLSERELEVLRLLQSDLDGPDMARELSVSLNTLRTHTKNIYSKLGVSSRRGAVRRAAELDLLPRG